MLSPLSDALAARTIRDYVCSTCWGHLLKFPAPNRKWFVKCHKCGDETRGYVTKDFARNRRDESLGEAVEVTKLLDKLGVVERPHKGKTPEELLKEIGI